jgi:hypothetical protein
MEAHVKHMKRKDLPEWTQETVAIGGAAVGGCTRLNPV